MTGSPWYFALTDSLLGVDNAENRPLPFRVRAKKERIE
jgi:hypothetical protein